MAKGYTNIPDWMLGLDLDIYETIVFAIIFGFSQDGDSVFSGSQNYLARKAKCSRAKITRVLPTLVEKGLVLKIDKQVRGMKLCEYKVSPSYIGCVSQIQGGCITRIHNNIDDNIDINTLYKKRETFKKPTIEEIREYCSSRGNNIDPETFFSFYESNGWMVGKTKMKDWKSAVITWEKRSQKPGARPAQKESAFEHNLRVASEMFGTDVHSRIYQPEYDEQ